jgi:uncharacterized membrane protein YkvA (DUF1232 family)
MPALRSLRQWARRLKRDVVTLWFAWHHPRTPRLVKGLCLLAIAYTLSPIDLIPDFVPVIGYLDDAIVLSALTWLALRMLPPDVLHDSRDRAQLWIDRHWRRPLIWASVAAVLVVLTWACVIYAIWIALRPA